VFKVIDEKIDFSKLTQDGMPKPATEPAVVDETKGLVLEKNNILGLNTDTTTPTRSGLFGSLIDNSNGPSLFQNINQDINNDEPLNLEQNRRTTDVFGARRKMRIFKKTRRGKRRQKRSLLKNLPKKYIEANMEFQRMSILETKAYIMTILSEDSWMENFRHTVKENYV
jgi:hypothetical protein